MGFGFGGTKAFAPPPNAGILAMASRFSASGGFAPPNAKPDVAGLGAKGDAVALNPPVVGATPKIPPVGAEDTAGAAPKGLAPKGLAGAVVGDALKLNPPPPNGDAAADGSGTFTAKGDGVELGDAAPNAPNTGAVVDDGPPPNGELATGANGVDGAVCGALAPKGLALAPKGLALAPKGLALAPKGLALAAGAPVPNGLAGAPNGLALAAGALAPNAPPPPNAFAPPPNADPPPPLAPCAAAPVPLPNGLALALAPNPPNPPLAPPTPPGAFAAGAPPPNPPNGVAVPPPAPGAPPGAVVAVVALASPRPNGSLAPNGLALASRARVPNARARGAPNGFAPSAPSPPCMTPPARAARRDDE